MLVMSNSIQADQLINAVAAADSAASLVRSVQALAAAQLPEAIPTLIATLGYNNPGAAVAAVTGLVSLGEAAVQPLLDLLDGYNYGARAWAIRALAEIGDPRALPTLLEAVQTDFALSVRRSAAKGLGYLHWHALPPEERSSGQKEAFLALAQVTDDPEWVVRYAVIVGLEALARVSVDQELISLIQEKIVERSLSDPDLTVRTRARLAQ
uniref:PBS lyase HEAT domain protein repeat-containing protein n=1 Tax=Cyanothece sp. (strain PCC 7425 / ATCC 29141) TaxID=395961 RepID=B8HR72_CYAP4